MFFVKDTLVYEKLLTHSSAKFFNKFRKILLYVPVHVELVDKVFLEGRFQVCTPPFWPLL